MSRKEIEAHERKFRKGQYMGKGWRQDFDAMALKSVYRKLIGKWGVMSIDYKQKATPGMVAMATAVATGDFDDENKLIDVDSNAPSNIDPETGEILSGKEKEQVQPNASAQTEDEQQTLMPEQ